MVIAYLSLLLLAIGAEESNALFFNRKLDCLVTEWSVWSAPYGFGSIMRERKILRYPQNGGEPCPADLVDEKETGKFIYFIVLSQIKGMSNTYHFFTCRFILALHFININKIHTFTHLLIFNYSNAQTSKTFSAKMH